MGGRADDTSGGGSQRAAGAWAEQAVAALEAVCVRDIERYARHLERQHSLRDPGDDVLTLGARRLLPLIAAAVRRPLPVADAEAVEVVAFGALTAADRAALWPRDLHRGAGAPLPQGAGDHLAAALWRFTRKAQAVRREADAPPVEPDLSSGASADVS